MSENTKWMPSVMEVVNAGAKFSLAEGGETIEAVCRRTGLRAQIEALESITYLFKHSDGIEELEAKIAALRKEIEG